MKNEEMKYMEALAKAAREYQEYIETNNPQAEAWDFYGAFIEGAIWRDKKSTKEKQTLIDKACEWMSSHLQMQYDGFSSFINDFRKAMEGEQI